MINNYFVFMPFSTFSWYTGNVFTFADRLVGHFSLQLWTFVEDGGFEWKHFFD
jgi:hypothetical protein